MLHMSDEIFEIAKNIREIEKQLPKDLFFRCHKAYIVSFRHVKTFDNRRVTMDNGEQAFISRKYLPAFKTAFQEYVLKYNMGRI